MTLAPQRGLIQALAELRAEWGILYRRIEPALRLLESRRPVSVEQLIEATGLSHRSMRRLMERLEPWLPLPSRLAVPTPADPTSTSGSPSGAPRHLPRPVGEGLMARLVAGAPKPRRELDHVPATPETVERRAEFMAGRYALEGADVLCLGDHDLTSLALAFAAPRARIAVVDVDEELLTYIDRSARELGFSISCWFGDLRLGLPTSLHHSFDLVFTDPPYTAEGLRLFAVRALSALKRDSRSRLLLCYGYSDVQPSEGREAQLLLDRLHTVIEEARPGFNRYAGAPAIGSASNLYVVQPLPDTWPAALQEASADWRIYSHGPTAVEGGDKPLPLALAAAVPGLMPVAQLYRLSERHARSRPERRPGLPELPAVDLRQAASLAPRLLLVNRAQRLRMVMPIREAGSLLRSNDWPGAILGAAYSWAQVAAEAGLEVLEAERRQDDVSGAQRLARDLVEHPTASLGSSLREGLIRIGQPSKNSARSRIAARPELAPFLAARPVELPGFAFRRLVDSLPALGAPGGSESRPV